MSQFLSSLSYNDGVLLVSLLYLGMDISNSWDEFSHCRWPVHRWLLVSYFFILLFRISHIVGTVYTTEESGDLLLNLRHKGTLPRTIVSITWLLMLPLFMVWTGLGSYWLVDSKRHSAQCLPMGMLLCFIITWQVLTYAWIAVHVGVGSIAWVLEYRLRKAESNLRAIEDPDMVRRWGQVSSLSGYTALSGALGGGLTPSEIGALPHFEATEAEVGEASECSICLGDIRVGDSVRQLRTCGHTFHRPCLDLWLLRRADCPLCKRDVRAGGSEACSHGAVSRSWLV